ncbi:MAG TPA: ABC transporter permease [Ruminiclostridium sp.]|nr:ABC transporter permease [Ruminiclostridium sp.]
MVWLFIKSDVKRYFRDKGNIVMAILCPVIFTFILSNAFGSFMNNKFEISPFSIGYTISDKNPLKNNLNELKKELKKEKITLVETSKSAALKEIGNDKLSGFVEFTDDGYKFYKNDSRSIDTGIFESVLQSISYETGTYTELYKVFAQLKINPSARQGSQSKTLLTVKKLDTIPQPSALTYYGIVMIINILCFTALSSPTLINNDRKLKINQRIALTSINPFAVFTGRVISALTSGVLQISIGISASVLLLRVNFGPKVPLVIGVMLLFSFAVSSFGVMLGYLIKNMAVTRIIVFAGSFFLNFFGGSYVQYIYQSGDTLELMKKTPLYYINRCLVELATQGSSSVLPTALVIIFSTIIGSVLIGAFVYSRREGKLCIN